MIVTLAVARAIQALAIPGADDSLVSLNVGANGVTIAPVSVATLELGSPAAWAVLQAEAAKMFPSSAPAASEKKDDIAE